MNIRIAVLHELATGYFRVIDQHPAAVFSQHPHTARVGTHHHIAGDHRIGATIGDTHLVQSVRAFANAYMTDHRPALLGKAGKVQHAGALTLEMGGHGDQLAHGHHAGAADARHQSCDPGTEFISHVQR